MNTMNTSKSFTEGNTMAADDEERKMERRKRVEEIIDLHAKLLDDLVSVNSLFTVAVFIGLSFASPNQQSLQNRPECVADHDVAKQLVMYEVLSFALFLVSSLAAKSLKVILNFFKVKHRTQLYVIPDSPFRQIILSSIWRRTLFLISTLASSLGITFLTLSMVNVIQIKLGKLSCGSVYTLKSVIPLTVLVFSSILLLYLPAVTYAACSGPKTIFSGIASGPKKSVKEQPSNAR